MAAAFDLFYRQGYRATGVNQVIAASGVAKASFYDHFPAKHDLLHAYISEAARREIDDIRAGIATLTSPRDRFLGLLRLLPGWLEESDYRGCPFQNIAAEVPLEDERVREVVRRHHENLRELLREQARELLDDEPGLALRLDAGELADTCLVLAEGAIVLAVAYRDPWPVHAAVASLERCLTEAGG